MNQKKKNASGKKNNISPPSHMINEDINVDHLTFKPLAKGLGFHKKKVTPKFEQLSSAKNTQDMIQINQSPFLKQELKTVRENHGEHPKTLGFVHEVSDLVSKNDFQTSSVNLPRIDSKTQSAFDELNLGNSSLKNSLTPASIKHSLEEKIERPEKITLHLTIADKRLSFFAYIIDLIIVLITSYLTIAIGHILFHGLLLSEGLADSFRSFLPSLGQIGFMAFITYMIYFSVGDMNQTIGKAIMSIETRVVIDKKNLSFQESFLRSSLTLISLLPAGLLFFLKTYSVKGKYCDYKI